MTTQLHFHSPLYIDALSWAAELHRRQRRKGKPVPTISDLIAVSGLLHDAIEDAGQHEASIAGRYGDRVGRIVAECTDTSGPVAPGTEKEPWLLRKTRSVASLEHKPLATWCSMPAATPAAGSASMPASMAPPGTCCGSTRPSATDYPPVAPPSCSGTP